MQYKILISVVTYNTDDIFLKQTLKKLLNFPNIYISIFDNGSSEELKTFAHDNSVLYNRSRNIGFGRGHNKNISLFLEKKIKTDYVLILNPDVDIGFEEINKLTKSIKDWPNAVIASPLLLNTDSSVQNFVRLFPSFFGILLRFFRINIINYAEKIKDTFNVPFIHGACYLISVDNFIKFAGFDEKYFLYCEDLDLCRKINESGGDIIVIPEVKAIHLFNRQSSKSIYLFLIHLRSLLTYYFKWGFFNSLKVKKINKSFENKINNNIN